MLIKLSDYVMQYIAAQGVKHVFMLPGGGAMHLNDSLGRCPDLEFICNLHEQAAAIAAEAYARVTNILGVALVTTGPGGTNAVTGVAEAWLDSTPCLFLSGQVKRADLSRNLGVRQFGVQEIDIVSIVKPITKYAITIMEAETIRYHLEKAVYLAKSGRPGPAWIDIPLDIQAAKIDPESLSSFNPAELQPPFDTNQLSGQVGKTIELLNQAERPVLLAGNGVRLSGAQADFRKLVERLGIPVLTTWLGLDLIPESHPLFAGRPGAIAPRGANFTLQNSDLLLSIGARLDMAMVGYAYDRLARAAKKIIVDIDPAEITKMKIPVELPVKADARAFIQEFLHQSGSIKPNPRSAWLKRSQDWKSKYPVVLPEHRAQQDFVSTFVFSEAISEELGENALMVLMSAGACVEAFILAFHVKEGQRIFHNRGTGAMGLALPGSIGACLANDRRQTICVEADGGFQMNIQELETIIRLKLPIKIFILNNQGYASIRTSQKRYFGRLTGADATSGLTFPDTLKVAAAYGFATKRISSQTNLREQIRLVLQSDGPMVCEVLVTPDEIRAPCLSSRLLPNGTMVSTPLEDLWPFLDRVEFLSNMIIPPLENN